MDTNIEQNEQKTSKLLYCLICDYTTSRKLNYDRHILTEKHKKRTIDYKLDTNIEQNEQNEQNEQSEQSEQSERSEQAK